MFSISFENRQISWLINLAVNWHDLFLTGDLGKIKWRVGVSLLDLEVSWLIVLVIQWDEFTLGLGEVQWAVSGVSLLDFEVSWLILIIINWHNLGEFDILFLLPLGKVIVDSIDYDVSHAEIFMSTHSRLVWNTWLVHGPVVERWILDWVCRIELEVRVLLWLLDKVLEVVNADSNLLKTSTELGLSHGIFSEVWIDQNWDTLVLHLDKLVNNWRLRFLLGKSDCDRRRLVYNEILEVATSDILSTKRKEPIFVGFLGQCYGNGRWLVNYEILQVTAGNVLATKSEQSIFVGLLSKCHSNW